MQLGYVIFYVPDVEAAIAFYERAFGMKRRFLVPGEYGELDTGATALGFASENMADKNGVSIRPSRRTDAQSAAAEIAFVLEDPAAAFDQAVAAGAAPVKRAERKPWGQTVAYVRDLNGFLVELCTPAPAQ
jgi:lactoylglutathione lyase